MCDDFGVDTIDVGVAVGVAMAGGAIPYGDADAALKAVEGISEGTPLGRVLRHGDHRPCLRRAPRALRQGTEPARL